MAIRSIVLQAGECAIFPATATVISVVTSESGQLSTDCPNVPSPSAYVCWKFIWSSDTFDSDAVFDDFILGSNIYDIPSTYNDITPLGTIDLAEWFAADPQFEGLVVVGCEQINGVPATYILKIQVPEGLGAPELKIFNPNAGGDVAAYLKAVVDEDCEDCSS